LISAYYREVLVAVYCGGVKILKTLFEGQMHNQFRKAFIGYLLIFILLGVFFLVAISLDKTQKAKTKHTPQKTEAIETSESEYSSHAQYTPKPKKGKAFIVFVNKLNIREEPSTKSKVIGTLSCGDTVYAVAGTESYYKDWQEIIFPNSEDKTAWVSKKYLIPASTLAASLKLNRNISLTEKMVKISSASWYKSGIANEAHKFTVTIQNKTCFYLLDPVFYIEEFGESGTKIFSWKHFEYIKIPPYGRRTVKFTILGHSQAESASIVVTEGKLKP